MWVSLPLLDSSQPSTSGTMGASTPLYDEISETDQNERDLRLAKKRTYSSGSNDKVQIQAPNTVFVTAATSCDVIICRLNAIRLCGVLTAGGNYFNLEVRYSMLLLIECRVKGILYHNRFT